MTGTQPRASGRLYAQSESVLLVLVLGSTLVIAKEALRGIEPLTLAALRYCVASLILLPFAVSLSGGRLPPSPRQWWRLLAIGLCFYALGNGSLFLGLKYVSAATASLVLGLVPLMVLIGGMIWLRESPTSGQLVGMSLALAGTALFFIRGFASGEPLGLAILAVGLIGNASLGVLGRPLAATGGVGTLLLTAVPLAVGGAVLLPIALIIEGVPRLSTLEWATVGWLAAVNTALAYLLYNRVLRSRAAFEVSALTSLSPVVTAVGGWLFLAEPLSAMQVVGMAGAVGGVALLQLARRPARRPPDAPSL